MSSRQVRTSVAIALTTLMLTGCGQVEQGGGGAKESPGFIEGFVAPDPIKVPAGTPMQIRLARTLNSGSVSQGSAFSATVVDDVTVDDEVAIPAGATVHGVVSHVRAAKKGAGKAEMTLRFTELELPGGEATSLSATISQQSESQKGRNAAIIGGSAAGGALLGKLIGKDTKDAVVGSIVGGAIGTGVVLSKEGEQVNLPAGTVIAIQLDRAAEVPA